MENLGNKLVYNGVSQFIVSQTNLANFNGEYTIAKQAGLLYAIDTTQKVFNGDNLNVDPLYVVDEVLFNSACLYVTSELELANKLSDLVPLSGTFNDVAVSALVQTGIQVLGENIQNGRIPMVIPLKNLGSWVRSKL